MGREKKPQASTFSACLPCSASPQTPLPTPTLLSGAEDGNGGLQSITNLLCFSFLLSCSVGFSTGSSPVRKICSSIGSPQVAVLSGTSICSGVLCGLQGRSALPQRTSSFLLS